MNQGIAFARTLRALDADDFKTSKLGMLAAVILLGAWTWWMFAARVPQYETTPNVQIEDGRALAYFPPGAMSRISLGQPALILVNGIAFPSKVQHIQGNRAELVFTSRQPPAGASPNSPPANAQVEISRISPAAIALRTLGPGKSPINP